jgi:hypothetical protein
MRSLRSSSGDAKPPSRPLCFGQRSLVQGPAAARLATPHAPADQHDSAMVVNIPQESGQSVVKSVRQLGATGGLESLAGAQ